MIAFIIGAVIVFANPDVGVETNFLKGVQHYQNGQFGKAEESFRGEYNAGRETAALLYNWGLSAYQMGRKGLGVALWRRALYVDPEFPGPYQALEFAQTELPGEVFGAHLRGWEWLRNRVLNRFDLQKAGFVSYVLFLVSAFLWIRFFAARQRALREELPLPPFPTIAAILSAVFVLSLGLVGGKAVAQLETRATVIVPSVALRTGPSEQDNALVDLIEGIEVIVRNAATEWVQVKYPGGPAGWVPKESVFQTTGGRKLW